MFLINKRFFFLFELIKIIFSFKTEINFLLDNVPSLFRCEKSNSTYHYINHFPIDQKLLNPCIYLNTNQRIDIHLNRLELLCENIGDVEYINLYIYFTINSYKKSYPSSVIIFLDDKNNHRIDLFHHQNNSNQILIAQLMDNRVKMKNFIE